MPLFAMARQVVVETAIGREIGEDLILRVKSKKFAGEKMIHILFVIRQLALKNADQARRIGVRQRPYEHRINNAENRNRAANAQRQSQNNGR